MTAGVVLEGGTASKHRRRLDDEVRGPTVEQSHGVLV